MSLLEDIFLGDEANEAQELERVIEGDEYDEHPRSRSRTPDSNSNSEKEDEAEEDKRRVDPATKPKRVVKNPRQVLNHVRLTGPRGISIIPNHFKDFKFKGKGHEKEDLDLILKKLEHWAYRLYPKFKFEDCLKKIETLGKKQAVSVHLRKIRSDQLATDEPVIQKDSSDDEAPPQEQDEFDKLLQQQIDLARSTPAPNSVKKGFMTPRNQNFAAPKATSSPSITDEQRERILRNRQLAEERRLARLKLTSNNSFEDSATIINKTSNIDIDLSENSRIGNVTGDIDLTNDDLKGKRVKKVNRSNVIESSDEENEIMNENKDETVVNGDEKNNSGEDGDIISVNHPITVDVHVEKETNPKEKYETIGDEKNNACEDGDIISVNETVAVHFKKERNGNKINQETFANSNENVSSVIENNKVVANDDISVKDMESNELKHNKKSAQNTSAEGNLNTIEGNTKQCHSEEMDIDFNNDF